MSEPETEEIWVCSRCGRKIGRRLHTWRMPVKCPYCGARVVKKTVVR